MKNGENDKWLDKALGDAIGEEKSRPDFENWQQNHQEEVEMLTSRAGGDGAVPAGPRSKGATVMKSRIVRLAAAAVIIAAALIGIKALSGLGEQSAEVPKVHPPVSGAVDENSDSPVDIELRQVRLMYAAGDVKGLAAILAEGQFESQLLAAHYLAQMEGGAEALEVLEKVQADYGKDDRGNPFTPAVQRLKDRAEAASGQGSPASAIGRGEPLVGRGLRRAPSAVTVAESEAVPAALECGAPPDMSEQPQDTTAEGPLEIVVEDTRIGPELVEGIAGRAYYFDGLGDYVEVQADASLDFGTGDFAVEAWIYPVAYGDRSFGDKSIVSRWQNGNWAWDLRLGWWPSGEANKDKLFFFLGSSPNSGIKISSEAVSLYKWHHVVATRKDGVLYGYLDGIEYSAGKQNGYCSNPHSVLSIGRFPVYEEGYFKGSIDEVAIYNRAISAEEIRQLYQNPGSLRGNEAGLVGYWNFDSDNGAVVKDSSPYQNDGWLCEEGTRPELTEGASGKGYYFDGDGDYIEIPPIEGLGTEQTKMLWIYLDVWPMPRDVYVLDEGGHQSNNNWIELLDSDGNGVPNIRAGFDEGNLFDSNGNVEAGYWYHIAVVSTSAGDVFTYINGVFDSSRTGLSATAEPTGIVIGADGQTKSACFKGIIDDVALFSRALSDDEIWQIYQNTERLRGNEPGLVGYWNFDRDEGDVVKDMGPYGNHGKLGGM
jgi:hypothetical protein